MKITHRTLARLERGYSITLLDSSGPGLPSFVAGSEGEGELLCFDAPGFKPRVIARAPGGYISSACFRRDGARFLVASTLFKPGFNAAASALRVYPLDEGEMPPSGPVAAIPYAHRVAVLEREGRSWVLVSTLCAAKASTDDWSQPGGIHCLAVPRAAEPWPAPRLVFPGLNKNHGFDFARLGRARREGYLVSALEGLFFLPIPADPDGEWTPERIADGEHSDAFAFDWNGDGEPEIFSISPFHGNVLTHHRPTPRGWEGEVIHDDLEFGHIVWAGDFLGRPGLLGGSRRGRKELRLYRPSAGGGVDTHYVTIDEGIGPSQLVVVPMGPRRAVLYVAAHGVNEIRLYELET
jgi:hypothetical protein